MFDVYIYRGSTTHYSLRGLHIISPELNIDLIADKLAHGKTGFLNLDVPLEIAKDVLRFLIQLENRRVSGRIISIRYRDEKHKFTPETAFPIAENEMKKRQLKYPQITFGPITYGKAYSKLECFAFFSAGKEWQDSGIIPGALFVNVDKLDGHIWKDHEGADLAL